MTYNVQRWECSGLESDWMFQHPEGEYVLAADAEAHEREAVEAYQHEVMPDVRAAAREQAIRDCLTAIQRLRVTTSTHDGDTCVYRADAYEALEALLTEGSE